MYARGHARVRARERRKNMEENTKREIQQAIQQVVKQNDLIQKSRFDLSLQEQKILLYIISTIKPADLNFKEITFQIQDFCKICGLDEESGANYAHIRNTLKELRDKSIYVKFGKRSEVTLAWIDYVILSEKDGTAKLKLNELMKPFLLEMKEKFTSYKLHSIIAMQSKYSIRLYELLKSYEELGECQFEIDRLKVLIGAEKYEIFANFKQKALDIAMREIEKFGDIQVSYTLKKQGRKFHMINFLIKSSSS